MQELDSEQVSFSHLEEIIFEREMKISKLIEWYIEVVNSPNTITDAHYRMANDSQDISA